VLAVSPDSGKSRGEFSSIASSARALVLNYFNFYYLAVNFYEFLIRFAFNCVTKRLRVQFGLPVFRHIMEAHEMKMNL
jgi:hypothetical protein